MILLNDDEIRSVPAPVGDIEYERTFCKAQAKKILIELQSIYKLPDLKMEHDRMGEFIQELMEEIDGYKLRSECEGV